MTDKTLYRYQREDGGYNVSPIKPEEGEYTTLHRLIADEGMLLKKGDIETPCIDTEDNTGWIEIEAPEEEEEIE